MNSQLYIQNRSKLLGNIQPKSLVIINSNNIFPSNCDGEFPFRQNTNLLYLTGILEPNTTLLLYKSQDKKNNEILFIERTSQFNKIWFGNGITPKEASVTSGIKNILFEDEFSRVLQKYIRIAKYVYLEVNEHINPDRFTETNNHRFIKWIQNRYPLQNYINLNPILNTLRMVKERAEVSLIQQACDITKEAFDNVLQLIKPGLYEYEIEAEFIYHFKKLGCNGFAYNPIVASGKNNCILHYTKNNSKLLAKDLLLIDIGVQHKNYNSDITRTIPISRKFSPRQRAVYNAVLEIQKRAKGIIMPGVKFTDYNSEVNRLVEDQLLQLKLLDKTDIKNQHPDNPVFKKYFMHGITHHLGLDVHDLANLDGIMQEGMVLTVEPGIYIPEERIGIRLEDDILITKNSIENLSAGIPIEIAEIESTMKQK